MVQARYLAETGIYEARSGRFAGVTLPACPPPAWPPPETVTVQGEPLGTFTAGRVRPGEYCARGRTAGGPLSYGVEAEVTLQVRFDGRGRITAWEENP